MNPVPQTRGEALAEVLAPSGNNLAAAICAISSKVETVAKLGYNDFHKYTFARMPDVLRALGPLMAQHCVTMMQSEVGHELIADGVLRIEFDFHIVHAPSGETHTIRSPGMAKVSGDRGGFNDRAIQAIATITRKYVLIALFGVVVDDLPDVDRGENERPAARRKPTQPKQDAAPVFNQLRHELEAISSIGDLQQWGNDNGVTIATLPADWQKALRFRYAERLAELRPTPPVALLRTARTIVPAPKHALRQGGIAERAMAARQAGHRSQGPSQPFMATRDGPRPLPPIDELPEHSAPPNQDPDIPEFLDRRRQTSEPSYVSLLGEG